eukprot:5956095-Prymnesium_polylepis.1
MRLPLRRCLLRAVAPRRQQRRRRDRAPLAPAAHLHRPAAVGSTSLWEEHQLHEARAPHGVLREQRCT